MGFYRGLRTFPAQPPARSADPPAQRAAGAELWRPLPAARPRTGERCGQRDAAAPRPTRGDPPPAFWEANIGAGWGQQDEESSAGPPVIK